MMIKTLLKHTIAEIAINTLFNKISKNFTVNKPYILFNEMSRDLLNEFPIASVMNQYDNFILDNDNNIAIGTVRLLDIYEPNNTYVGLYTYQGNTNTYNNTITCIIYGNYKVFIHD